MRSNGTDDTGLAPKRVRSTGRRRLLGALGTGAVVATTGCTGLGSVGDADGDASSTIHPSFGYAGTAEDDIPEEVTPEHTVGLHVDEEKFIVRNERPVGVEFGAFHFEQAGLHVAPGDVVRFQLESADHTITSLHPGLGRQQRVPDGVPWFSSPVIAEEGFWLYEFTEPGVYDLVCSPHELLGMGMRVVAGDVTEPVVHSQGRPPSGLAAVLLGTGIPGEDGSPDLGVPPMAPDSIVDAGEIHTADLSIDLGIELPRPTDPSEIG